MVHLTGVEKRLAGCSARMTGQPISVAFYLMGAATISLLTVLMLKDHTGEMLS